MSTVLTSERRAEMRDAAQEALNARPYTPLWVRSRDALAHSERAMNATLPAADVIALNDMVDGLIAALRPVLRIARHNEASPDIDRAVALLAEIDGGQRAEPMRDEALR